MNNFRMFIVATIWITSAVAVSAGLWTIYDWLSHPLAPSIGVGGFLLLLYFVVPHLIIGFSAYGLRHRTIALIVLLVFTVACSHLTTSMRYVCLDSTMSFLDAKMAGRKLMSCGPPPQLFLGGFELFIFLPLSLIFGCVALFHVVTSEPKRASVNARPTSSDVTEDVHIKPATHHFRGNAGNDLDRGEFMAD